MSEFLVILVCNDLWYQWQNLTGLPMFADILRGQERKVHSCMVPFACNYRCKLKEINNDGSFWSLFCSDRGISLNNLCIPLKRSTFNLIWFDLIWFSLICIELFCLAWDIYLLYSVYKDWPNHYTNVDVFVTIRSMLWFQSVF